MSNPTCQKTHDFISKLPSILLWTLGWNLFHKISNSFPNKSGKNSKDIIFFRYKLKWMAKITTYLKNYSKFSKILVKFGTKLITSLLILWQNDHGNFQRRFRTIKHDHFKEHVLRNSNNFDYGNFQRHFTEQVKMTTEISNVIFIEVLKNEHGNSQRHVKKTQHDHGIFQRRFGKRITMDICYYTCKSNTLFFYKNIFYKNIEAEICEILRTF